MWYNISSLLNFLELCFSFKDPSISFMLQFSSFGTNWVALAQKAILVDSPLQITLTYSFSYLSCLYPISLATSL